MKQLELSMFKPAVFTIDLHKSKRLLRAFVDSYNEEKPLRDQIRVNHMALVAELLEIYRIFLWRQQASGIALVPGSLLPYFRVNNSQLGSFLMCSDRSVQNLRHRLKAAKVIVDEIWHGSNSSYEVQLNPAIIHLAKKGDSGNHIQLFGGRSMVDGRREAVMERRELSLERQQEQGHILHSYGEKKSTSKENFSPYCNQLLVQVTNKLNKLEVLYFDQKTENQLDTLYLPVENAALSVESGDLPVGNSPKAVDKLPNKDFQGTRTGYETIGDQLGTSPPVAAAPPSLGVRGDVVRGEAPSACGISPRGEQFRDEIGQNDGGLVPETFSEVVSELPDALGRQIFREVNKIWVYAQEQLYPERWIAATEVERAKARLAEYFIRASPKKYEAGTKEICGRIRLVRKWIDRGHAGDPALTRYVPIPSIYFDCRNHRGFRVTKSWYKKHLAKRAEFADNIALTKAIKQYQKSKTGTGGIANKGPADTYLELVARLAKRNIALVQRFQEGIV